MMIFLILLPFGVFSLLMLLTSADVGLFAAAAICLAVIAYRPHSRPLSSRCSAPAPWCCFSRLGFYLTLVDAGLSASAIKLTVDAGVLAIALVSLAIRHPFTLQYAREVVDAETAVLPGFIKANYIITWAWAACMLLMMTGNVADDLSARPAAVGGNCDRLCRPQHRRLFHQMVSGLPQGKVHDAGRLRRRAVRLLKPVQEPSSPGRTRR